MAPPVIEIARDMGLTHREFMRSFPHIANDWSWRHVGDEVELSHPTGPIVFKLENERTRRIANLHLPATMVRIKFDDAFSAMEADAFMAAFDLSYRRGGG